MMRAHMFVLCGILAIASAAAAQESKPGQSYESVRARYEQHAAEVTVIDSAGFIMGDPVDSGRSVLKPFPRSVVKAWSEARRDLEDRTVPVDPIVKLTQHEDPKVRTLAALALFAREDHTVLPPIAALWDDKAETFSEPVMDSNVARDESKPTQVRWIALEAVGRWMNHVGGRADRFAEYWEPRKDRAYLASSYLVRVERASWHVIKDVRLSIDALPEPDRDWVLLWVCDQLWSKGREEAVKYLASNADLVAAGKRLGPAKLMEALTGNVPFDDPDVAGKAGKPQLSRIVLTNAAELLRSGDADLLLATAARDETKSPRWIIAAAAVSPDRAEALLEDALKNFKGHYASDRGEIAVGLWTILGETKTNFLVDWFYSQTAEAEKSRSSTSNQTLFMTQMPGIRAPADRKLVARIVRDLRLEQLGDEELQYVIGAVHRWAPFESTYLDPRIRADWIKKLRASIPKWENP